MRSKFRLTLPILLSIFVFCGSLTGASLYVATTGDDTNGNGSQVAPYSTIQKAVDSASNGDAILVLPGTYAGSGNREINTLGKLITIQSSDGPLLTIIDCGNKQAFIANSGETQDTIIDGFSITNGYVSSGRDWSGLGIIHMENCAYTVRNCIFYDNSAVATYLTTSMAIIYKHSGDSEAGLVENCLFYNNSISDIRWTSVGGGFGGLAIGNSAGGINPLDVKFCTFADNTLNNSGGITMISYSGGTISNCVEYNNQGLYWRGEPTKAFYGPEVSYCLTTHNVPDGSVGVLSGDPIFLSEGGINYALAEGSPAIDSGDPSLLDPDGSRADMGFRLDRFTSTTDSDGDGLNDSVETNTGVYISETDTGTDPNNADTDGDFLIDGFEVSRGLSPLEHFDFSGNEVSYTYIPADFSYGLSHPLNSTSTITHNDVWDITNGAVVTQASVSYDPPAERVIGYGYDGAIISTNSDFVFNIPEERTIKGLYIHTDGDRSTSSFQLYSKNSNGQWIERANVSFNDSGQIPYSDAAFGVCIIFAVDFPDFTGSQFKMVFGPSNSRLVGSQPRILEVDVVTAPDPLAPVLDLETFYESNSGESITIDATPTDGYPSSYTYQWSFKKADSSNYTLIQSAFGGTVTSFPIDGNSGNNGTWKVEVTNEAGTTAAEFNYRVYADSDNDGLSDGQEEFVLGTHPNDNDSDDDTLPDGAETNTGIWVSPLDTGTNPLSNDSDSDGLNDGVETNTAEYIDASDTGTDPNDSDSDNDGLLDGTETNTNVYVSSSDTGTHPLNTDSDTDGYSDYVETNTGTWTSINDTGTDPNRGDTDNDGIIDGRETNTGTFVSLTDTGTDPNNTDSDGDGFTDKFEIDTSYDPTSSDDTPDAYSFIETAVEVNFYGANGGTYRIEHTDDIESDIWVTVENDIEGSSELIERLYSTDDYSRRFFRVVRTDQ